MSHNTLYGRPDANSTLCISYQWDERILERAELDWNDASNKIIYDVPNLIDEDLRSQNRRLQND